MKNTRGNYIFVEQLPGSGFSSNVPQILILLMFFIVTFAISLIARPMLVQQLLVRMNIQLM